MTDKYKVLGRYYSSSEPAKPVIDGSFSRNTAKRLAESLRNRPENAAIKIYVRKVKI
ncbi:hypothetical protein Ab1vBOLIVR4_gp65 [Agrobacterium phage OLIVR4]|nr:hypothetical protein Ab1vBOLIVR4_gp65 [Agrobacterium phage OLIVR4]